MVRFALIAMSVLLTLSACGGGSGGGGYRGTATLADEAVGGLWSGTDAAGLQLWALSTEGGRIHLVTPSTGEQGFGTTTVNGSSITIDYTYVASFGDTLVDGSTSASCRATGSIQERQSLSVSVDCSTALGGSVTNSATFAYDSLYDRESSLVTIAGNYDDAGNVLNISANGVIFEQQPGSGCIINGQVGIIDADYNAYDITMTYVNCRGPAALFNGATFTGLGLLDNSVSPEVVTAGLTGEIGGVIYSYIVTVPRL